jgi:hypothetical protein
MAERTRPLDEETRASTLALYAEGLTQAEVAARIGMSQSRVSRILREADVEVRRGFARLSAEQRRQAAALGGRTAQAKGTAHRFTHDEAVAAGSKGGRAAHEHSTGHRFTPEEAREAVATLPDSPASGLPLAATPSLPPKP